MANLGDFLLGATISCRFTTVQATGAPTTLAGSPVISCYPSGTTTELTAGITLTADYDSRTGFNNVAIVASNGNGYATGTDYDIVITTGTVNSVSVVGYVVGTFSIQNRFTNVAQIGGQTASASGTITFPNATLASTTNITAGIITTVTTVTAVTGLTASNLDATISSRMATYSQPTGFLAATFPSGTLANTTNITAGTITTVTTVTGLTASNLDATITSRMATYTQPTGFLAATFPTTVASPTNITTVAMVTNLTNAPTAGDFTPAMKTSLNAATPVVTVSDKTGFSLSTSGQAAVADKLLNRNQQGGADSAPTVSAALAGGLMEFVISGSTLTVKNGDGTTAYTRTLSRLALDAIISSV